MYLIRKIIMIENILTLGMLILLQAVLGFDNLLYISLESKRAPEKRQAFVRKLGIGLAIILRIGLLFLLINLVDFFQEPWFSVDLSFLTGSFNFHSIIVLFGGVFIVYTAMKEIWHMLSPDEDVGGSTGSKSTASVITWIVIMNVIFSFDSILSAMALTDVFWIMTVAIVVSGILMIWLSDKVADFLTKNRMYEVLGLFILFVVGIMLVTEGGHLAHLNILGEPIVAMSKTTFYFVIGIVILNDIVQSFYAKKLKK